MGSRYIGFLAGSLLSASSLAVMLRYDIMRKDELLNKRMAALNSTTDSLVKRFEGITQSL